jgi:hypothetical protein
MFSFVVYLLLVLRVWFIINKLLQPNAQMSWQPRLHLTPAQLVSIAELGNSSFTAASGVQLPVVHWLGDEN